jgi:hypothetical protein
MKVVYVITSRRSPPEIRRLFVHNETSFSVWVGEEDASFSSTKRGSIKRYSKEEGGLVHDTWESAHAALLKDAEESVQKSLRTLKHDQATLEQVRGLREVL